MRFAISTMTLISTLLSSCALGFDATHADWSAVLKRYLTGDGRVMYEALKRDSATDKDHPLRRYSESIQSVSRAEFDRWTEVDRKAFLINAYNALTVQLIVSHHPVKTIRDIGGFFTKAWDVKFFKLLDGTVTSLDPIEHKLLRPLFRDERIHAAVNCASISCPPLSHEPFVGNRLDAQLDDQMRRWLADRSLNEYEAQAGAIKISKIFDWYEKDFADWGGGIRNVVRKYGPEAARAAVGKGARITFMDYDWRLNEAK